MHLLIADDHTLFRDAIVEFIRRENGQARVSVAKSFTESLEMMRGFGPDEGVDLVLLDLRMPGMAGLSGITTMQTEFPGQKIAILSGTAEQADVSEAMALGAVAYFPKTMAGNALVKSINLVLDGERFVPLGSVGADVMPSHYADATTRVAPAPGRNPLIETLTPREREVLTHLAQGAANKEIARILNLQTPTVKLHVRGVCRKLNAKNRTHAALIAKEFGIGV